LAQHIPLFSLKVFHIINKKYCSLSLKFSKLSTKKLPHFSSNFLCYLTESIPTFFSLLTKSIPLCSLKFSTLFNKKHCTFFSQVFQVMNKKYLTFLKCLSRYLIKSNAFLSLLTTSIPLFSFKFSTLFNKKTLQFFSNFFSAYLTKSITSVPWWSPALTGVLYSPGNQQGQMHTNKSTLVKTKLYCIVHQQSCTLLYILSLPLVHPAHRQLPTISNHFTGAADTGTSCMRSPS